MITLPNTPGPRAVGWTHIDAGGTLPGALGGADQYIDRLGSRHQVNVTMPPMTPAQAEAWAADLTRARREGASWRIRQVGMPAGSPGAVLVKGGSQAGSSLLCDGFTPGYVLRKGQWLSVLTGGQRYLYKAAAALRADGAGEGTITLDVRLRVPPADNDPVEIGAPLIEGLLVDPHEWLTDANRLVNGFSFSIRETR